MKNRSFTRGLVAGVVVKLLWTAAFTLVLTAVFRGAPAQDGNVGALPWAPFSGAWFAARAVVLAGAVLAGAATVHWSRPGSWAAPLALAIGWFVWSAITVDLAQAPGAVAVRLLVSPVGILLGAFAWKRWGRAHNG